MKRSLLGSLIISIISMSSLGAQVSVTTVNAAFAGGDSIPLDFNNDQHTDIYFGRDSSVQSFYSYKILIAPANPEEVSFSSNFISTYLALAYQCGDSINAGNWESAGSHLLASTSGWNTNESRYAGYRIETGPGIYHYGWLRLRFSDTAASGDTLYVESFGYNPMANQQVLAGEGECVLGLANQPVEPQVAVYPNPAADELQIELEQQYRQVKVTLRDKLGKILAIREFSSSDNIALAMDGPAGIYFLEVETESWKTGGMKIMKQ